MSRLRTLRERLAGRLFRIGPPEPAPIILGQRRIYVLPTPAGLVFAVALLVMLMASVNYNLSLGYALVFLLGGVGVASMIHAFRNLLHLSVRPGRVAPVFAGEMAEFHLLVGNARGSRRPALMLAAHGEGKRFDLGAGETLDVPLPATSSARGWMPLSRVVLQTTYPLGLVRAWSVLIPDLKCLVYPAPERRPPPLPTGQERDSGQPSQRAGDEDFAGLRPHRVADSPRHVAWKAVARGGPMLTKAFSGSAGGEVRLDWDELAEDLDVEARVARLAAWVVAAELASVVCSLNLPDRPAADVGAEACLKRLALFRLPEPTHG